MKIIIVGAGISGLSLYLLLKKHLLSSEISKDITVTIYDAYDVKKLTADVKPFSEANSNEPIFTPVAIGNALGVSQNGLRVLQRLDDDGKIIGNVKKRGNVVTVWRMSNARGWTMATINTTTKSKESQKQGDRVDMSIMIARQDLWEVFRDEVIRDEGVIQTKRVSNIVIGDHNTRSVLHFDDGTSDEADLIIGADGLRSPLRRAMFEQSKGQSNASTEAKSSTGILSWFKSSTSSDTPASIDYITPHYEGLGGFGGFIPTKELQHNNDTFDAKTMNIVFGRNGFFGYGCISSSSSNHTSSPVTPDSTNTGTVSAWWSTFSSPTPYPYNQTKPSTPTTGPTFNSQQALADLLTRHKSWNNTTIQQILHHTSKTGLTATNFYPTWTTPELPTWHKNGACVLVGDAAHTLQPSSGQGASQALEDAEALALLLTHYLRRQNDKEGSNSKNDKVAVAVALQKYEALRKPRVHAIYERSQRFGKAKGDMGVAMELFLYLIIWVITFFHDSFNERLLNYDLPSEVDRIIKEA